MTSIRYFDGQVSKAHTATIMPVYYQDKMDGFTITYGSTVKRYFAKEFEYLPSVSHSPHVLMMADGARVEFIGDVPDWLSLNHHDLFNKISQMENRWAWIGVSLAIMCVFVFGVFKFGIPLAAHHIAQKMPADTLMAVGDTAQEYVMDMTKPSTLPKARQDEIIALYDKLNTDLTAKIIVRNGDKLGANALAIPNNTIIITDELIRLTDDDRQILAVLAHEKGHLVHRHSLEQAISSLGVGVLVVVITGDTSDLLLALPTLLAVSNYSQKAEMEADKFAIDELKKLNISSIHLANFFRKMQAEHGDKDGHWSMLSTHPKTDERIWQAEQYQ
ncbi:M48 family metallopeptidase [Moraxella nasovis]|uniref:M48 family metallopeptidase n=1 Tax=Moraxella nasovis TaxID=2904121 RepID=UPI001F614236|nr:M48 family metallopeptidase [Moraxella nasovis]UNU72610.1 M48 family metallopeptidase [Moraxella nasovis]